MVYPSSYLLLLHISIDLNSALRSRLPSALDPTSPILTARVFVVVKCGCESAVASCGSAHYTGRITHAFSWLKLPAFEHGTEIKAKIMILREYTLLISWPNDT